MDFDKEFYKNVTALKGGRAKRKVSLALGGWNDSKGDKYSRLVNDPKARRYVLTKDLSFRGLLLSQEHLVSILVHASLTNQSQYSLVVNLTTTL